MTASETAVHAPADHAHHGDLAVAATRGERRTAWVVAITFVTMIAELIAGQITGSLALTAVFLGPLGLPIGIQFPLVILIGVAVGAITGVLIVYAKIDSIIATLGVN